MEWISACLFALFVCVLELKHIGHSDDQYKKKKKTCRFFWSLYECRFNPCYHEISLLAFRVTTCEKKVRHDICLENIVSWRKIVGDQTRKKRMEWMNK